MHKHDLEKEIRDVLKLTDADAFAAGTSRAMKATTWLCEVSDALHALASKLDEGQLASLAIPATGIVLQVWDDVVVPQDMPGIPAGVELMIESSIRSMLPSIVFSAFALAGQK